MLAGAEEFSGAAQVQIGFGDVEAVGGGDHGFQALRALRPSMFLARSGCRCFLRAAADASAKLVELREAEALGVLDDHDGGVGDVDADFDDRGGDEDVDFAAAESAPSLFLFRRCACGRAAGRGAAAGRRLLQPFVFDDGGFERALRFRDLDCSITG